MNEQINRELDWDDEIQNDSNFDAVISPGVYSFFIESMTRKRFNGSVKLPPCPCAELKVHVLNNDGDCMTSVTHNLFLHSKTEGLICQFFKAIGFRKHGEKMRMDWTKVPGATGKCAVGIRKWISEKTGKEIELNEIKKFVDPETETEIKTEKNVDDIPF